MFCREYTLVKSTPTEITGGPLKCRSWGCDLCHGERRSQLIAMALAGKPNIFLTLTIRSAPDDDPADQARRLSHAWRLLRKRILRWKGIKRLPFIAVFEEHESGQPHLHLLLRSKYLPQDDLSEIMRELLDSPVVWIESVKGKNKTAAYCAKYCGKANHRFGNAKRYWRSQDYDLTTFQKREENEQDHAIWLIARLDIDTWVYNQTAECGEGELDGREWYRFRRRRHWSDVWSDFKIL